MEGYPEPPAVFNYLSLINSYLQNAEGDSFANILEEQANLILNNNYTVCREDGGTKVKTLRMEEEYRQQKERKAEKRRKSSEGRSFLPYALPPKFYDHILRFPPNDSEPRKSDKTSSVVKDKDAVFAANPSASYHDLKQILLPEVVQPLTYLYYAKIIQQVQFQQRQVLDFLLVNRKDVDISKRTPPSAQRGRCRLDSERLQNRKEFKVSEILKTRPRIKIKQI